MRLRRRRDISEQPRVRESQALGFDGADDARVAERNHVLVGHQIVSPSHGRFGARAAGEVVAVTDANGEEELGSGRVGDGGVDDVVADGCSAFGIHAANAGTQADGEAVVQREVLAQADFCGVERRAVVHATELVATVDGDQVLFADLVGTQNSGAVHVRVAVAVVEVLAFDADRAPGES